MSRCGTLDRRWWISVTGVDGSERELAGIHKQVGARSQYRKGPGARRFVFCFWYWYCISIWLPCAEIFVAASTRKQNKTCLTWQLAPPAVARGRETHTGERGDRRRQDAERRERQDPHAWTRPQEDGSSKCVVACTVELTSTRHGTDYCTDYSVCTVGNSQFCRVSPTSHLHTPQSTDA